MAENIEENIILSEEEFEPVITSVSGEELKPIQKQFIESYIAHKDEDDTEKWLSAELKKALPERTDEETNNIAAEIVSTLKEQEAKKASLNEAISNGRSKEAWFAEEIQRATSNMSSVETVQYLNNLDSAIAKANDAWDRTITTKAGEINMNPSLNGFIAEQYHAQTFNLNAEAASSHYRAKVLEPNGTGYNKNSVDIVIADITKKPGDKKATVGRYQSKYGKDAAATERMFKKGKYNGQQKLVPEEQGGLISKKHTTYLKAPDGTKSNPLSQSHSKELQNEAQSGNWNELNWNSYKTKDLAIGIGKRTCQTAFLGAATGAGFYVAEKVWNGEQLDGAEIVETAISSGADFGIKAATAGALKVGVEKDIIPLIPKGTPADAIASIAFIGVENAKVISKIATDELTFAEGLDKMEQVTVSTAAGISYAAKGTAIGEAIGLTFGPVGAAIGGFVGGTIGYMAGSKIGETVLKGVQKIRKKAVEGLKALGNKFAEKLNFNNLKNKLRIFG